MKRETTKKIPKSTMDRILNVGKAFDKLENPTEIYNALIMILTSIMIEDINEGRYESVMDELKRDVIDNVKEVEVRLARGTFPFDFPPTEGTA